MTGFLNNEAMNELLDVFYVYGYAFVIIAAFFSLLMSALVDSRFKKYSKVANSANMTGAEAAKLVLNNNGVFDVDIKGTAGNLTDHFNPKDNTIYLSSGVMNSRSVAAIGVACHEAGHAIQHAKGYFPIKLRTAIVPITNIGSKLAIPVLLIGFIFAWPDLAILGALLYGLCVVFQLVTLPTEFNASRRALEAISESGYFSESDERGAKKTLSAAAMTYVAALAATLVQFLRLLGMANSTRRRR